MDGTRRARSRGLTIGGSLITTVAVAHAQPAANQAQAIGDPCDALTRESATGLDGQGLKDAAYGKRATNVDGVECCEGGYTKNHSSGVSTEITVVSYEILRGNPPRPEARPAQFDDWRILWALPEVRPWVRIGGTAIKSNQFYRLDASIRPDAARPTIHAGLDGWSWTPDRIWTLSSGESPRIDWERLVYSASMVNDPLAGEAGTLPFSEVPPGERVWLPIVQNPHAAVGTVAAKDGHVKARLWFRVEQATTIVTVGFKLPGQEINPPPTPAPAAPSTHADSGSVRTPTPTDTPDGPRDLFHIDADSARYVEVWLKPDGALWSVRITHEPDGWRSKNLPSTTFYMLAPTRALVEASRAIVPTIQP